MMPGRTLLALAGLLLIAGRRPAFGEDEIPAGVRCDPRLAFVGNGTVPAEKDVRPPRLISKLEPTYPPALAAAGTEGKVTLNLTICDDGVPRIVEVLAEKPAGFRDAATQAVRQWKYEPATLRGEPVAVQMVVMVHFRMPQPPPILDEIYGADDPGIVLPEIEQKVAPDWPEGAERVSRASVDLEIRIAADGRVVATRLLESSDPRFAEAAVRAVKQWRYRPATKDGRPVDVRFKVVVNFRRN
jgi:TonB family protein